MSDIRAMAADSGLSGDETQQIIDEVGNLQDLEQVNAELLRHAALHRPTVANRVRQQCLAERQIGLLAATRFLGGDMRAAEGVGIPAHYRAPNQVPGQQRHAAPTGRFATQAFRALDGLHARGLGDGAAAVADRLARNPAGAGDQLDSARDLAQRWLSVCGSEAYERAWAAIVRDPVAGGAELDEGERAAWRAGRQIQAALGESGSGSYMVPTILDPAILLSNAGSNNPLRQVARVETITTDRWHGVTSAGASAEWSAEGAEAADASPALEQPGVPVYKMNSFVPFSLELEGDVPSLMAQLSSVLVDAADLLAKATFTTGSGVGIPAGFVPNVTQLAGASGAFTSDGVYLAQNSLPPRFSANASWLANIAVMNTIGAFETSNGALQFPEIRTGNPPTLLHKPIRELSDMTNDMSTADSPFLAYGSWKDAFIIIDRIGSSIELVPHLSARMGGRPGNGAPICG